MVSSGPVASSLWVLALTFLSVSTEKHVMNRDAEFLKAHCIARNMLVDRLRAKNIPEQVIRWTIRFKPTMEAKEYGELLDAAIMGTERLVGNYFR